MPFIANVVAGQPIQSVWGNNIRDCTIQHFATTTERDSQWVGPPKGAYCITLDTMQEWRYDGTKWVGMPAGRIAYATGPARDATQGLFVHVQVNFTLATQRLIRIDAQATYQYVSTNMNVSCYMNLGWDVGRQFQFGLQYSITASQSINAYTAGWAVLPAGAHTAEIHAVNNMTTGAMRFLASAAGSWIAVHDYGSA